MLSLTVYKIIHVVGVMMLFLAIGGSLTHAINRGGSDQRWRKGLSITHGVGLLLILVAGFGMMARLNIGWPWPGWIYAKLLIWIMLGGLLALSLQSSISKVLWFIVIVLGITAAYLGLSPIKPF